MPRQTLYEQLDAALEAMLGGREAAHPVRRRLGGLLQTAAKLRDLPRRELKERLKSELSGRTSMAGITEQTEREETTASTVARKYHTITPYLVVQDVPALIEFMKQAFGAEQTFQAIGGQGGIHAEVRVGTSTLMIGGGGPQGAWRGESIPQGLHIYVQGADEVYRRALQAGASPTEEPVDQPYGDREAGVKDNAGNIWWIATRKQGSYIPPGFHTVTPFLHPLKAAPFIKFLKRAWGAEEISQHAAPDGVIHYAAVRIGDSMLEMGEAHGAWQPMPSMFLLHVEDVDAWYRRALDAGATSIEAPADQPYGDRRGGVKDAFGNQWYVAAPIKAKP